MSLYAAFTGGNNSSGVASTGNVTCTQYDGGTCCMDVGIKGPVTVTGTFWPATQPVSGTFFQATQPVSGTVNATCSGNVGITGSVAVTGTFFQATQPISAAALPLPAGAGTEATLALIKAKTDNLDVALSTRAVTGLTDAQLRAAAVPVSSPMLVASSLLVTATAAVNTALTATLPAVAGQFHYITNIQITKLYSVVGVASAAGNVITTTNLPGSPSFTTEQAVVAAGLAPKVVDLNFGGNPLKSSVANTNTTIVCPQQLQTIWRVVVTYFTAA